MVAIVLVAHSVGVAAGVRTMLAQVAPDVPVRLAAGTARGGLGTSAEIVEAALRSALEASPAGAVVLLDIGSAALALEIALESLSEGDRGRIAVSRGPFLEGAVMAAVAAAGGTGVGEVLAAADGAGRIAKLPDDWSP